MLQSLCPKQTLSSICFKSLCLLVQGLGAGGCPTPDDALISVVLIDGTSVGGAGCLHGVISTEMNFPFYNSPE